MKNWLKFLAITLSLLAVAMCFGPKVRAQSTASTIYINCVNYSCSPDIGVGINAAFTGCPTCRVVVPSGSYTLATTINYPLNHTNKNGELTFTAGSILTYTGSACAISAMDNGLSREIFIDGHGEIVGNSG